MKKSLIAVLTLTSLGVLAQSTATVTGSGTVTVTQGNTLVTAGASGTSLQNGAIILSGAASNAVITVNIPGSSQPCLVSMGPNTVLSFSNSASCSDLNAAIRQVAPSTASAAAAAGATGGVAAFTAALLAPIGFAAYGLNEASEEQRCNRRFPLSSC